MQIDAINPRDLTCADIAAWRALLAAQPDLSSPFLTPEWAYMVARHRPDARIAVFREGEQAVAFLPVQRSGAYAALPAGSPVCDVQALIAGPDACIDLSSAARALDVGRIDFTAALSGKTIAAHLHASTTAPVVSFASGWAAYCAARQAAGSTAIDRAAAKLAKLRRDHSKLGPVAIETFSHDRAAFEQLIDWKRSQLREAGEADIFQHAWIVDLLGEIFSRPRTATFGGALFVLRVEGRAAAILFCLRARGALHAWFSAQDPTFAEYAPGLILFAEAVRHTCEDGFTEMHLRPGDASYRERFANVRRAAGAGFAGRPGFSSAWKAAQFQTRALVEYLPLAAMRNWPRLAMQRRYVARGLCVHRRPAAA